MKMFTWSNHIGKQIQIINRHFPNYELKLIFQFLIAHFQKQNKLKIKGGSRKFFKGGPGV